MDIDIDCPVPIITSPSATPAVFWFKNNQLINNGNSVLYKSSTYEIIEETSDDDHYKIVTLNIKKISVADEGLYKCYHRGIKYHAATIKVIGRLYYYRLC